MCKLIGGIVEGVYSKISAGDSAGGATIRLKVFRQIKTDLDLRKGSLPTHLTVDNFTSRTVDYLAPMHEQTTMLLSRSCLSGCCRPVLLWALLASRGCPLPAPTGGRQCVGAAMSSIHIMSALRTKALLSPFSFHDAIYCSSALHPCFRMASMMTRQLRDIGATSRPIGAARWIEP